MNENNKEALDWVIRIQQRNNPDKWYFIDKSGNVNARLSSAMRVSKDVAQQAADAISRQHYKYTATARRIYADGKLWHPPASSMIMLKTNIHEGLNNAEDRTEIQAVG